MISVQTNPSQGKKGGWNWTLGSIIYFYQPGRCKQTPIKTLVWASQLVDEHYCFKGWCIQILWGKKHKNSTIDTVPDLILYRSFHFVSCDWIGFIELFFNKIATIYLLLTWVILENFQAWGHCWKSQMCSQLVQRLNILQMLRTLWLASEVRKTLLGTTPLNNGVCTLDTVRIIHQHCRKFGR